MSDLSVALDLGDLLHAINRGFRFEVACDVNPEVLPHDPVVCSHPYCGRYRASFGEKSAHGHSPLQALERLRA